MSVTTVRGSQSTSVKSTAVAPPIGATRRAVRGTAYAHQVWPGTPIAVAAAKRPGPIGLIRASIIRRGNGMAFIDAYERSLTQLEQHAVAMGRAAADMLADALAALFQHNQALAAAVMRADDGIDDQDAAMERDVLELISLLPPRQADLRRLAALLRVARDLERIADYACDIAEVVPELGAAHPDHGFGELPRMGQSVARMLDEALDALVRHDATEARAVNDQDDYVDALYARIHQELVAAMEADPAWIRPGNQLVLVARYLERVADHAVNVAEMTVYMVDGYRRPFHHGSADARDPA